MTSGSNWWQRWVVFFLLLVQLSVHSSLAIAQTIDPDGNQSRNNGVDAEPPLIEHDVVPVYQSGGVQVFEATVVDDQELQSVTLFYRLEGETSYNRRQMKRISTSSSWRVEVPVDSDPVYDLQYYIEASDRSGNRTFRGFTFNPLIRRAPVQPLTQVDGSTQAQTAETVPAQASGTGRKRVMYYVLGALAVGVVAGLASAAGGDDDDGEAECCTLTLTVEELFE